MFSKRAFYTLDVPGALDSSVWSINQFGQVVGQFTDAAGTHGFYASPKAVVTKSRGKD